jgi:peroxidase
MQIIKNSILLGGLFLSVLLASTSLFAQDDVSEEAEVSPARRINQPPGRGAQAGKDGEKGEASVDGYPVRTIDGSGNNVDDPQMGKAVIQLIRLTDPDYGDGISTLSGEGRPSARVVSNGVCSQRESKPNKLRASDFLWQWGQFVDHDIDLTDGTDPPEPANIAVPAGDLFFDPDDTGTVIMTLNRSIYDESTGTGTDNPRQQLNEVTAWIDASNVYGSDDERAAALRTNDGTGKLKTSEGNFLPFNTQGLPNAGGSAPTLFLAGDVRANEQVGLTSMHTLFVREHNRLAEQYAERHPNWDGEHLYQKARELVGAQMQVITYKEYLPALLGRRGLTRYKGYNSEVDARIANMFSAAAYRYGHSALNHVMLRLDAEGNTIAQGNLELRDAFFSPQKITQEGGVEPLLRGLANQKCQSIDPYIIDDVRNFLFGDPGSGGFDLAALNIQRGRDHGIPGYNDAREAFGLVRAKNFRDVSSDPKIRGRLSSTYDSVDDMDMWAGGLAEDPLPDGHLGELFYTVVRLQFEALRDGDRFWYQETLSNNEIDRVERTKLSDIIRRNTDIGDEIQDNVFHVR